MALTDSFSATRILGFWDQMRSSFWFLPSLMALCAIAISFGLIQVDVWLDVRTVRAVTWLYAFGPEGARAILSAIAGSMVTVAGITFSITMLTLQLASSQFGPRLLRNFMSDRGNQIVLGTFTATFLYCLLVLRTVRGTEESSFVPHLAVAFGVLLAIASLAILIYFIHHVATSIRIEVILQELAVETSGLIDQLYPARLGRDPPPENAHVPIPTDLETRGRCICVPASGYVQRVDSNALMKIAKKHDLILIIKAQPGRFVTTLDPILLAYPEDRVSDDVASELRGALIVGSDRTPTQDLQFAVWRIVEVAQRAMSPGINDPTTALYCIDRLSEVFEALAGRCRPSEQRVDDSGALRILANSTTLTEVACPAFTATARYAMNDSDVICRLLEAMARLAGLAPAVEAERIVELASEIQRTTAAQLCLPHDKATVLSVDLRKRYS